MRPHSAWNANMCMLDEIRAKRDEIYAIARRHKAEKLWVFGSYVRREGLFALIVSGETDRKNDICSWT